MILAGSLVFIDRVLVLSKRTAEVMTPVVPGDEIKVIHLCWVEGRFERALPGIGDRTGWKASIKIGVVGSVQL